MSDLRLAAVNGEQTIEVGFDLFAASFVALADAIERGEVHMEQAIVVAVIDGAVTYTPIGHVTLIEGVGLLELASRKIERDMLGQ